MYIEIPQLNTYNAIDFCRKLYQIDPNENEYLFDVSGVSNFEPFGMLLSSAAIRQFQEKQREQSSKLYLHHNDNRNFEYACHMGYFQSFGFNIGKEPGEAHGSRSYIPITKINVQELMQEAISNGTFADQVDIIEEKAKELSLILGQGNKELCKLFQYLIREAIRNVPEHAETNNVWICGQYWRNRSGLPAEIAIVDEGIGIMKSLCKNKSHREFISSNIEALKWAIKPGVSTTFDPAKGDKGNNPNANSGYGLYIISEICKMANGCLTLLSGKNCLQIFSQESRMLDTNFHGTAVSIRLNTCGIHSYQDIITKARKRGERTAQNIKNAFKEASVPSKGLLEDFERD